MTISRGRSGINMFCTIALCLIIWAGLICLSPWGLYYMVTFFIAVNTAWLGVWRLFAWQMIRLRFRDVFKAVTPFFVFASTVMLATWYVTQGIDNIILRLISKIIVAVILYCGITFLSGAKIMRESIDFVLKRKHHKTTKHDLP